MTPRGTTPWHRRGAPAASARGLAPDAPRRKGDRSLWPCRMRPGRRRGGRARAGQSRARHAPRRPLIPSPRRRRRHPGRRHSLRGRQGIWQGPRAGAPRPHPRERRALPHAPPRFLFPRRLPLPEPCHFDRRPSCGRALPAHAVPIFCCPRPPSSGRLYNRAMSPPAGIRLLCGGTARLAWTSRRRAPR